MKKLLLLVFSFLFVFACQKDEKPRPPQNQIPPEKMANILIDIHVQQSAVAMESLPPDSAKKVSKALQQQVFEKYDVADSTFRKNYNYYVETGEMEQIYEIVVDSLGVRETKSVHENDLKINPPAGK